jgi:putative aldouronate transport system permease protein
MKSGGNKITIHKKNGVVGELLKNRVLYLMFLPLAVYFLIFAYFPMAGIVVAFKDFNYRDGLFHSPWNGIDNFQYFFRSGQAMTVTVNTVFYNLVFLTLYTFFSILVAICISEINNKWLKRITQSMMFLPYFISWVVISAFMYNIFNVNYGLINNIIRFFGGEVVNIYAPSAGIIWRFLLPTLYVWKWIGYGSVLYLAAIMGIDRQCYEAAEIDGANIFQRIWHITIPMLWPTVVTLLLLGISRVMRGEFDMIYQLIGNNGALFPATDIIDTLVFRSIVASSDFPMASAAGLYQSILCFAIILSVNYFVRKKHKEYALF